MRLKILNGHIKKDPPMAQENVRTCFLSRQEGHDIMRPHAVRIHGFPPTRPYAPTPVTNQMLPESLNWNRNPKINS